MSNNQSSKWCKWYCFLSPSDSDAKKTCNKPNCHNKDRAKQLTQQELKKIFEKQLLEAERALY